MANGAAPPENNELFENFVHFCAGTYAGAAGVFAGHPLDTVKVRLQTQGGQRVYRGTFHCFTKIVHKEGFHGLYKGLSSPLASLTVINATVFGVHGMVSKRFADPTSIECHFLAGCSAGLVQSVFASPSERLKLLMQIQSDAQHTVFRSPLHAARELVRRNGIGTLYRGFIATVLRDCPAFGVYFASYDFLARRMSKDGTLEGLSSMQLLLAGGAAGMSSWLFNYPTDVVKTRFQTNDSYRSYLECAKVIYREGGWRSFFVGFNSTLIRAFPSNAATFFTVEWTYRLLLDFKILERKQLQYNTPVIHHSPMGTHVMMLDFWHKNSFLLPEAGSTSIDPMLRVHHYQLLSHPWHFARNDHERASSEERGGVADAGYERTPTASAEPY